MLIERKKLFELFCKTMVQELFLEYSLQEEKTLELDPERTRISIQGPRKADPTNFIKNAQISSSKISEERKEWILSNLHSINPIFLKSDYPEADLYDYDEVRFYVLAMADEMTKNLESKMAERAKADRERRERENLEQVEKIKQKYKNSPGSFEPTGVIQGAGIRSRASSDETETMPLSN